jgi:hypothetical protein
MTTTPSGTLSQRYDHGIRMRQRIPREHHAELRGPSWRQAIEMIFFPAILDCDPARRIRYPVIRDGVRPQAGRVPLTSRTIQISKQGADEAGN